MPGLLVAQPLRKRHELLRARRRVLAQKPGVVGFSLAERLRAGVPTGELVATVYVTQKRAPKELQPSGMVPEEIRRKAVHLRTDVVEVGAFEQLNFPGASIGPDRTVGTFGSLGCFVLRPTGVVAALSAMHVAGRMAIDANSPPVPFFSPDPIHSVQPVPLGAMSLGVTSPVDAGRIDLPVDAELNNTLPGGNSIRGWRPVLLPGDRHTPVMLFGATSGFVTGQIEQPDVQLVVQSAPTDALFAAIPTNPGDSGAVLLDEDGYALGLLAGRLTGGPRWSVFSKLGPVLNLLDCDLPLA
jgi:hypothetical protein